MQRTRKQGDRAARKRRRKDPAAVRLGHKGGVRRAQNLTPEELSQIGRRGAAVRWSQH